MLTIDSSGLLALVDRTDPNHAAAARILQRERPPRIVPVGSLCETMFLLDRNLGNRAVAALLEDIERGAYELDCGEFDVPRIRQLITRYADMRLGYADAAVIACAERRGGRVLTFDRRHFGVVAREGTIRVLPEPETP